MGVRTRVGKLGRVEGVEELGPEFYGALIRQPASVDSLGERRVPIGLAGADHDAAARVAETESIADARRRTESTRVHVTVDPAIHIARGGNRGVGRTGAHLRALCIESVNRAGPGIGDRQRRSGLEDGNARKLPVVEHSLGRPRPVDRRQRPEVVQDEAMAAVKIGGPPGLPPVADVVRVSAAEIEPALAGNTRHGFAERVGGLQLHAAAQAFHQAGLHGSVS